MLQQEALEYALKEFRHLPLDKRNEQNACSLAMELSKNLDFKYSGDKYQLLAGHLKKFIGDDILLVRK
ncbi:MAG: hypothetical protein INF43_00680 [Alphaproteobacteria bacterium]|nr:hypothetical protein [Alphaproteobacteria bacterium]